MKYCPSCQIKYADDSLRFCLQDGTGLLDYSDNAPPPTVHFSEKETVVRQKPVTADFEPVRVTKGAPVRTGAKKSNTPLTIILTALIMCVIFGGVILGWILLRDNRSEYKNLSNINGINTNRPMPSVNIDEREKRTNSDGGIGWKMDYNASLDGERLTYYRGTTAEQCQADCAANPNCKGFALIRAGAYNPSDPPMCYLLSKVTGSTASTCCISGIRK